ncbi:MAG: peptidoglycan-binding protein [Sphingomonadaceae bacterium]
MVELTHRLLTQLADKSCFRVERGPLVFFGVRGMLPVDVSGTPFSAAHKLVLAPIDHRFMRCTLGIWKPVEGKLAVVPGSTVPHVFNMQKWIGKGGAKTNMLMLGKYLYSKGHHVGKYSRHRAFRQAIFFPVWRTNDDLDYESDDIIDNDGGFVSDNLHCASNPNLDVPKFGSAGCQVVAGIPGKPNSGELGPWKVFIDHTYNGAVAHQNLFEYLLYSGFEVSRLADQPSAKHFRTCRFGSRGPHVGLIQQALHKLGYPGFLEAKSIDEDFGRNTLEAVLAFQRKNFGVADGVVGEQTASALEIEWDTIDFGTTPSAAPTPSTPETGVPGDWLQAAVKVTCGFETAGDPYLGVSGNFDGQGISCGAMQWNIGQGSLQPMVKAVGKPVVDNCMPTFGQKLWDACHASRSLGVTMVADWHVERKLPNTAKNELRALMGSPEMRAEQDRGMSEIADKARLLATQWANARGDERPSQRAFMLFFDIVCQNGSMKGLTYASVRDFVGNDGRNAAVRAVCASLATVTGRSGHVKDAHKNAAAWSTLEDPASVDLLVLSFLRAGKSLARWRHVVLNRKGTIAVGHGWANSTEHDLSQYGI